MLSSSSVRFDTDLKGESAATKIYLGLYAFMHLGLYVFKPFGPHRLVLCFLFFFPCSSLLGFVFV
jgi:hypothetical protein